MRNTFKIYPNDKLPKQFKFPDYYLKLSRNLDDINKIEYFPWWFEDAEDDIDSYVKILKRLTGVDYLISFARNGDWAACFKITDFSGDPRVYVYDLGNKNSNYEYNDFNDWLQSEIKNIL
ncbi:SMI1/KNR4 family protein [Pasteurellaceae bacterium USgator41]|nr:SMI1/KNR4 family protein [Pasteurellaceae bacterium USgator41]